MVVHGWTRVRFSGAAEDDEGVDHSAVVASNIEGGADVEDGVAHVEAELSCYSTTCQEGGYLVYSSFP